jgi:ATP-dependent Lon protease
MSDGKEKCSEFIKNAKQTLDQCVYGLEDAKMQIMQMLGQWIANPASIGSAIAIKGPPGTGKTSLIKDGVSKILGREFAFIALGGAGDSSFLEGHSYTYEGSTWGKIVQILIDSKCMNPVIYFDELDKISNSARGQEIIGILTHLIDTSQNSQYHDKYFSEVDFDLSKCLFIFSYNDETLVNPILKDRMYCIQTSGYQAKEKVVIARNYLLPKIREQVNFNDSDIIIPDETINHIISTSGFTSTEDGVRNLKRCLEIIHTKLNLFRLVDLENDADLFKQLNLKVTFPFTVTKDNIDIILKSDLNQRQSLFNSMYI